MTFRQLASSAYTLDGDGSFLPFFLLTLSFPIQVPHPERTWLDLGDVGDELLAHHDPHEQYHRPKKSRASQRTTHVAIQYHGDQGTTLAIDRWIRSRSHDLDTRFLGLHLDFRFLLGLLQ